MKIKPFNTGEQLYYADTCKSLIDAGQRGKIKYNALSRFTYPGKRLTNDTIGLNSVGYWDGVLAQDWGLDWHRNEGIEIHFLESGTMPYHCQESEVMLTANDITITRPWESHKVGNPHVGIGKMYWLILDVGVRKPHTKWHWPDWVILSKPDLDRLTMYIRLNEQPFWKGNGRICGCFQKLRELIDADVEGSNSSKLRFHVNELLLLLLDLFDNGGIKTNTDLNENLQRVNLFIHELQKTLHEPWTLDEMAKACGLGVTHFTHIFKQVTNQTPIQYLNLKRIELAQKLLHGALHKNITDIAMECGFSSGQYFATLFKKQMKVTPQEYRTVGQFE